MSEFQDKTAIVVGGGSGIGAATSRQLSRLGAHVVVLGPDEANVRAVAAEIGGDAIVGPGEDQKTAEAAVRAGLERTGHIDHLVCCAGIGRFGAVTETDDSTWRSVMAANLDSAFVTARAAVPELVKVGGSVVVVSSAAGLMGTPHFAAYVTSKHALLGLVRSMAVDYGPMGVRVNAVCPGLVKTPMAAYLSETAAAELGLTLDELYLQAAQTVPLRKPAEPEDIADVLLFLLSDRARSITGAVLSADGGLSAMDPSSAVLDQGH